MELKNYRRNQLNNPTAKTIYCIPFPTLDWPIFLFNYCAGIIQQLFLLYFIYFFCSRSSEIILGF